MTNVTRFLTRRLKLKVNEAKSAVIERKFLGFSFSNSKEPKRRIAPKALVRCKQRIRELTRRTRGISLEQMTKELAAYLRGWKSYFGFCQTPSILRNLNYWIRRRVRSMIWKQWKHGTVRFRELRRRDVSVGLAAKTQAVHTVLGVWRTVRRWPSPYPMLTSPRLGFLLCSMGQRNPLNRRMRTRMSGGVAGENGRPLPLCRLNEPVKNEEQIQEPTKPDDI
jgi:Group II intron, maturase-specific domain